MWKCSKCRVSVGGTFEVCWNCGTSRDGTEDHGFRRQLFHELTGPSQRLLKGIRWLLLKNQDNLDNTKNERQRLERALKINKPLAIAYYSRKTCGKSGSSRTNGWRDWPSTNG